MALLFVGGFGQQLPIELEVLLADEFFLIFHLSRRAAAAASLSLRRTRGRLRRDDRNWRRPGGLASIQYRSSGRFGTASPARRVRRPVQLRLSCVDGGPNVLSAELIFDCTRRAASSASLVWVLPLLTASPISNRHLQMFGSSVGEMVYWMPL